MINYCKQLFGNDINDVQIKDLQTFFDNKRDESTNVEAKSFDIKNGDVGEGLKQVIKTVCAFLNSNGGVVVWGAPKEEDHKFVGDLTPIPTLYEKDSLISKISDKISAIPFGIRITRLDHEGGYIYIIEVQESPYSPHQVFQKYWMRLDGQTRVAPHYLVEALFKKITYPNLEGYIDLQEFGTREDGTSFLRLTILIFNFSELQNEESLTYSLLCGQGKFQGSGSKSSAYGFQGHNYTREEKDRVLHFAAPITDTQTLLFKLDELAENHNHEMDLILAFGGRKSPMKFSTYKLDFNIPIPSKFPFSLIKTKEENEIAYLRWERLGFTRESTLKGMLNR